MVDLVVINARIYDMLYNNKRFYAALTCLMTFCEGMSDGKILSNLEATSPN